MWLSYFLNLFGDVFTPLPKFSFTLWTECPHYTPSHMQRRCGMGESALHNSSYCILQRGRPSTNPLTQCLLHGYFSLFQIFICLAALSPALCGTPETALPMDTTLVQSTVLLCGVICNLQAPIGLCATLKSSVTSSCSVKGIGCSEIGSTAKLCHILMNLKSFLAKYPSFWFSAGFCEVPSMCRLSVYHLQTTEATLSQASTEFN